MLPLGRSESSVEPIPPSDSVNPNISVDLSQEQIDQRINDSNQKNKKRREASETLPWWLLFGCLPLLFLLSVGSFLISTQLVKVPLFSSLHPVQGEQGLPGKDGIDGLAGPIGPIGQDGGPGPTGIKGQPGASGAKGSNGAAGVAGADGTQGPAGANGATGSTGATGATGAQGAQGIQGPPGSGGGGAEGLQDAYDLGNTILTAAGRDIAFTLSSATNENFTTNIQAGSTGRFAIQDAGSDLFAISSGDLLFTSANLTLEANDNGAYIDDFNTTGSPLSVYSENSSDVALFVGQYGTGDIFHFEDGNGSTFDFANGGALTLANGNDSTASFQIQSAFGDVLFTTDTTGNQVVIGNASAFSSAQSTLFVVDSASGANEPTGVNGGIYYSTDFGAGFQCYEFGAYRHCISDLQDAYDIGDGTIFTDGSLDKPVYIQAGNSGNNDIFQIVDSSSTNIFRANELTQQVYQNGTTFSGALNPSTAANASIDWSGSMLPDFTFGADVGTYNSLTMGPSGLPILAYYDATNQDLKFTACLTLGCGQGAGSNPTTVDSTGDVGQYATVLSGQDGLPLIAYYDNTNGDLKLTHCTNAYCSTGNTGSNTISTVDSTGNVGQYISGAVDRLGYPHGGLNFQSTQAVFSYYDATNGDLKIITCLTISCSARSAPLTVDSTNNVGQYTGTAIGTDGDPIVSYYDVTNGDLRVIHCGVPDCSSGNTKTLLDSTGNVGQYSRIAIGADGLADISYYDVTNHDLKFVHCGNTACSSGNTINTVVSTGDVGQYDSITVGSDGFPIISYYDNTNPVAINDMRVVHCTNRLCSATDSINNNIGPNFESAGTYTNIINSQNGGAIYASFYDYASHNLWLELCGPKCPVSGAQPAIPSGVSLGSQASPFLNVYTGTVGTADAVSPFSVQTNNITRLSIDTVGNATFSTSATFKNPVDSTTSYQFQNAAGTTLLGIDATNSKLFSGIADGASAIGFVFNTSTSYSTAGAKLISVQNNTGEKFAIDKDGNVQITSGAAVAFQGSGNAKNVVTKKFVCTAATSAGDVVVIDTSNAGQVTTTATANNAKAAGVVSVGSGAGGTCEVAIAGTIQATMTTAGAVAIGDLLVTSGTTGQGQTNNAPAVGTVFGKALSAKGGGSAGSVWVLLSNF